MAHKGVSSGVKGKDRENVRDALTRIERELDVAAALVERCAPGAPKVRSPYTVGEAVSLDDIEKKAAAKASSVGSVCLCSLLFCYHRFDSCVVKMSSY
jgi:hypothetical protein